MTIDRDQLRAHAEKHIAGQLALGAPVNAGWLNAPTALTLLDQLDAAERRADEAEAKIERLENRAASETARADAWREKHRIMAKKRDAAHRARQAEARLAEEKHLRMKATAAATKVEARIKAVEDVLAAWHVEPGESGLADDLLRALNT